MDVCSIFPEVLFLINKPIFVFFFSLFQFVKKFNFLLKIPVTIFVGFFFVCLVFWSFLATLRHMQLPSQGSEQSHSCSNAGSLTHWAGPGIKPASLQLPRHCRSSYAIAGAPVFVYLYFHSLSCLLDTP